MSWEHLPEWLRPLAELAGSVDAEQLAPRFPHPPANARPAAVLMLFADQAAPRPRSSRSRTPSACGSIRNGFAP